MADRNFTIVFQADTAQAIAGMYQMGAEFKMLEAYINGAGGGVGQMTQQMSALNMQLGDAAAHMAVTKSASAAMLTEMIAMNAGFMLISAGVGAIGELGAMATKARDHIKELTIETMGLRDEMRELANLKGADGPDNVIAGETIEMAMKAGMMPKEMVKYLEQYEGSSPAGEQKGNIDAKTKEELALEGAKFGARVKLSAGTAGDLAGVVSQYTDLTKDKDGKEVPQAERTERAMSQMGRVEYGLNMGRGKLETLTRSLINTAGAVVSMGGPIEDLGDLAAIQGVASTHANPKESGTRVRQAVRALRDTKGDAGKFLTKTAGIKETDTHIERLEKIKKQVDIAKKNGKAGDQYLRASGFSDEDEMRAVLEQVEDLDIIKKRIAEGRATVTGKNVMEKDARFQTQERVGQRRTQMAKKAGQEFLIGESNERYEMAKENAEQQLRSEHKIGGATNNAIEWAGDLGGLRTWLGGESSREGIKGERAEQNLIDEAKKKGIDEASIYHMLSNGKAKKREEYDYVPELWEKSSPKDARTDAERTKGFNALATEVERRGGNPYGKAPDLSPKFDALIKESQETNRILKQVAGNNGGMPAPGAAGIPPMRGAAAPKRGI